MQINCLVYYSKIFVLYLSQEKASQKQQDVKRAGENSLVLFQTLEHDINYTDFLNTPWFETSSRWALACQWAGVGVGVLQGDHNIKAQAHTAICSGAKWRTIWHRLMYLLTHDSMTAFSQVAVRQRVFTCTNIKVWHTGSW